MTAPAPSPGEPAGDPTLGGGGRATDVPSRSPGEPGDARSALPGRSKLAADRIELRGLRVLGRCGVLPIEVEQAQPLELDLDLSVDLSAAGASDDLADTVDYGAVTAAVEQVVTAAHVALLERLATLVAEAVLSLDGRIASVAVAVRKLRPPVPQHLVTSGVWIQRGRPDRRRGPDRS